MIELVHSTEDGIVLTGHGDTLTWVRVLKALSGRLPDPDAEWRWVRLDTITAVIPHAAIAIGDDRSTWQYIVCIEAGGAEYHPTALQFTHKTVRTAVDKLLHAVSAALAR